MRPHGQNRRRLLLAAAANLLMFAAAPARAQHAGDNPVTAADDAYGLTLGLESVGLYSAGLVRGFSPQAAGNVRIDGLYFDQQGGLSNRVVEGSVIRVGISEIGYAFPAPTGIVDYNLRRLGGDTPSATLIGNLGPYAAHGVSLDVSLPLLNSTLLVPVGVAAQVSTATPYGAYPGYTSTIKSAGATPQWSPNDRVTVRAILDWQQTTAAKTFPIYYTAGDFLPPPIPTNFRGQDWAEGRNVTVNLGGLISARLSEHWSLNAGLFRSTVDAPVSYADLYTDIQRNGRSDHVVVGFPEQFTGSTSGEARLTGAFGAGDFRQQVILMARGRETTARYGGQNAVDLGPADLSMFVQSARPQFAYSVLTDDQARLWSAGVAYHVAWRRRIEVEAGVQQESYHETVAMPGTIPSDVSAHPLRLYGNAALAVGSQMTLYGGYTQGLENSGTAPSSAANGGAVLPASKTWQLDAGLRYAVTPRFKIIAGVFELEKPYFNLASNNIDERLGLQRGKGVEFSIAGEVAKGLTVNVGMLDGGVGITGPNLAAAGVGPVAVGQPRLIYNAAVNYALPWIPKLSLDASVLHFGAQPESVDDRVYTPATNQVNLGGRYGFTALGHKTTLRLQAQNALGHAVWTNAYTPGFFRYPGPKTVFAYFTTDFP
ncbi:hypothetical protein [Phenylobacterium sp.]|uniref:hypothetical protein n=1 Tax=Phenylobacterium sp. TaxID=1871053 RepID=UPI00120AB486|nr:hypothetical protein [Phenylobacterium sp.]THD60817.1 MAG: hypothetical protein E8A49_12600 [Phenylobacterium sp.]